VVLIHGTCMYLGSTLHEEGQKDSAESQSLVGNKGWEGL